jgi:hypothetical protein
VTPTRQPQFHEGTVDPTLMDSFVGRWVAIRWVGGNLKAALMDFALVTPPRAQPTFVHALRLLAFPESMS